MADSTSIRDQAEIFSCLGSEIRLQILRRAVEQPVSAPELADDLGVKNGSIHHHLEQLERVGFLKSNNVRGPGNRPRKEYRLAGDGKRVQLEVIEDDYDFDFREPSVV